MKTMYRLEYFGRHIEPKTKSVEVERETDKFVKVKDGLKELKRSGWYGYFDTKKEAWEWLLEQKQKEMEELKEKERSLRADIKRITKLMEVDCE